MEYEKNLISEHLPQNEFFWNACKLVISSIDKIDEKEVDGEKVKSDPCSGLDSESMSNVGELPDV